MRSHRLDRLARLTQGIALVGLGISEAACGGEPRVNSPRRDEQPHINGPRDDGPAPVTDAGVTGAPKPFEGSVNSVRADEDPAGPPHKVNATPKTTPTPPASASAKPAPAPVLRTNAPPKP